MTSSLSASSNVRGTPIEPLGAQPTSGETVRSAGAEDFGDGGLVGSGRSGGEGECDLGQAEFEQRVAAAGRAVIIALGRPSAENFDLAVVQPEAAIDCGDLRLQRALIGQQDAGRAAFDDGGRNRAAADFN